jgi:hypothetical protein
VTATEDSVDDVADTSHRCDVPDLEPGQRWICPVQGCGQQYGQTFAPQQPPTEQVNVGFLLHEVAEACIEVGHTSAAGTPPRELQNAFYRLGGQLERAARTFGHIVVVLPVEQPRV